jgi:hypothetical protein
MTGNMGFFPPFLPNLENKIVSGLLILVINWLICFSKELELWDIVDKLGLFLFFFVSNRIIIKSKRHYPIQKIYKRNT